MLAHCLMVSLKSIVKSYIFWKYSRQILDWNIRGETYGRHVGYHGESRKNEWIFSWLVFSHIRKCKRSIRHQFYLMRFRKWFMVYLQISISLKQSTYTIGLTLESNLYLLCGSCVCDPPLKPNLLPWFFRTCHTTLVRCSRHIASCWHSKCVTITPGSGKSSHLCSIHTESGRR